MKIKILILSFLGCAYSFCATAQTATGKVTGTVNNKDGQAVEAAIVSLLRQKDSAVLRTAVTDKQGGFTFNQIAFGTYLVTATAQGYQVYQGKLFELPATVPDVLLAPMSLSPVTRDLQEVTVAAQKPFIERKIDRLIVNVASSPIYAGQSAFEVLEKSPGVSIDDNGTISINGKQGAQVYVDGRIRYLSGIDLVNYLRGIPASQLDQVEIMTQPSAKYDASGNAGIINLKIKKNQANGFTGNFSIAGIFASYFKTRDNLSLFWKKDKFNIAFNYSTTYLKSYNDVHTERSYRTPHNAGFSQYLNQQTSNIFQYTPNAPRLTVDYKASKNTILGFGVDALFNVNSTRATGPSNLEDSLRRPAGFEQSVQTTKNHLTNMGFNLNLQQKLDKNGKELSADADYIFYRNPGSQTSDNYFYDNAGNQRAPYLLNSYFPFNIDIYSFKSDYSQPLPGNTKLEAGIKSSYVQTNNNAQYTLYDTLQKQWMPDAGLNNHFIYKENINAAYINISREIKKKWTIQLGLRAEQTISKGEELAQNTRFKRNYFQAFPTAYISYAPNPKNTFMASYGRRIDRPNYQDLNPFQYVIDQYTIREGNPFLQPVFTNNIEAGYNFKGQLDISLNYTTTNGLISNVLNNVQQGNYYITIQTRQNVNSRRNMGLAVSYNRAVTKWWKIDYTITLSDNRFTDQAGAIDTSYSLTTFRAFISNQFPLSGGWTLDLTGFYLGKRPEGVLTFALPARGFSLGCNKKLLKGKGTLTMNMNEPLLLFKGPVLTYETDAFASKVTNVRENRYLTVTFNYRFGKAVKSEKRQSKGGAQDERGRVNL